MSRSRRKTPIVGHTTCGSEREDKKLDLYQITFFDLQHRPALSPNRKTATRHFFWQ